MALVLQTVFIAACAAIYRLAVTNLDFRSLFKRPEVRQQVIACILMLVFLWILKTGIQPGLDVHFLGLTAVTLMLGWRLSIVVAPIALLLLTLFGVYPWQDFGVNLFLGMLVPICFTYLVFLLTYSYLSRHLFVYIFIAGFFNAALTIAAQMFSFSVYYKLVGAFPWHVVVNDYFAIVLLMLFPEGVLNGMCIAGLVMYKPTWVTTFLDRDYLHGK
ncbi:MAG TPA: energy-coupling factor ABC transporter permease [Paenalcaligenes sp.]|nr:energy-coupling factor ABC transporter permease [Paenalcaligenes sp.]